MAACASFIKLRNTGSGTVEVHWDALEDGSYKRVADYTSDFSPADADNGTWQLFGSQNGAPMLGFIKLKDTAGTVEVHWDALEDGSYKRVADYTSDFSPADADNGTWQLFGSQNGAPMLGFIKLKDTAGTVEVHWDALEDGSYKRVADYTSDFSPADANIGTDHYAYYGYYVGSDGAMHLWFWNGSSWADQTLGGSVLAGTSPSAYTNGTDHYAYYVGSDGAMHLWFWNGSSWADQTLGGSVLAGTSPSAYTNGTDHYAYYVGSDGAMHLWFWNGSSWADQTLGGSVLAGTSPSAYTNGTDHYAYYVGSDGAMHLWFWNGSSWADQTLGGSVLAGTSPSAYTNGTDHYAYYVGSDGAMHLWFWNGSSWADQTLGGSVLAGTSPFAYTNGTDHYAYYVGSDGAMHLWFWNGSSWADQTLGGSVLAGTSPSAYTNGTDHYAYYVGSDGAMHLWFWNGSSWADQTLGGSVLAGTSPSAYTNATDNGTWQLFGNVSGAPILGFTKLRRTGSGTVEVHWDALEGGSYKRVADDTSDFSPADADNGTWQLFGIWNGEPMLGFIKLSNTGSGTVEVHWDALEGGEPALEGGAYKRVADYTSDFSPADADNGTWQLVFLAPTIITAIAPTTTQTGATLGGVVNPQGSQTGYHFDYGTTTNYGLTAPVPDGSAGSGTGQVTVSQAITDLQPNTFYNYRFTAANEGGTTDRLGGFATLPPRPTVTTELSTNPGQTGATLNGEVNPYGAGPWGLDEARYYFQYGLTTGYGSQLPNPSAVLSQPGPQNVSQDVSGLQPGTTYHARLVAKNIAGISFGNDVVFPTTAPYTPHGYSSVTVYNRLDSQGSMALWAWDLTVGGPWHEAGSADYQNSNGSPGYVTFVPSEDTHSYELGVIDLSTYPHNDPMNDPFAWELPSFECDPRGPAYPNQTAEGE